MKTYLFDIIDRFKRFSHELDVQTVLCQKAWFVLNEDGNKEVLIFQPDGNVIVSVNGNASTYTWKYIQQNDSVLINHTDLQGTMLRPAFYNEDILAFQKDGTNECMFMLDDNSPVTQKMRSIDDVKRSLLAVEAEEKKRLAAIQFAEAERVRKEKEAQEKAAEEDRQKRIEEERKVAEERNYWKSIQHICSKYRKPLRSIVKKYDCLQNLVGIGPWVLALCGVLLGALNFFLHLNNTVVYIVSIVCMICCFATPFIEFLLVSNVLKFSDPIGKKENDAIIELIYKEEDFRLYISRPNFINDIIKETKRYM